MNITKEVTPEEKRLLEIGDAVIKQVKQDLHFGSSNQQESYNAYGPEAKLRTRFARQHNAHPQKEGRHPRRMALAAVVAGAGNCGEMAACAYVRCRESIGPQYQVLWVSARNADHSFCLLGKLSWFQGHFIVVDPWPTQAQAVLYEDHFMYTLGKLPEVLKRNNGKGANIFNKYAQEQLALERQLEEFLQSAKRTHIPFRGYNQQYVTREPGTITYRQSGVQRCY
ncbi:hypothetical protein [Trinickia fusca]|uniref:Uncharacterized protein n=1 Tax=Trinickia fusca TaxID=2419777 RepID=A0A494XS58_9BURK|nr:hypothetical protein [Trinickia fusca]RKP52501.1 hypothetical protein D7S89_03040 [Trinickia fusca]